MTLETEELIERLGADATPVRPLPAPMTRAVYWLSISVPYAAVITLVYWVLGTQISQALDTRFLIEELALLATCITAATAAFCCIVPGRDNRVAFLPLIPLAVWFGSLTEDCLETWFISGSIGLGLPPDWSFFPKWRLPMQSES